jgi:hypothetical protein
MLLNKNSRTWHAIQIGITSELSLRIVADSNFGPLLDLFPR